METITGRKGKVACPASFEFLDPLAAGYKLHFTTPAALRKHRGVCAKCAARMAKKHAAVLNGKVETPAVFEHHHQLTPEEDHAGLVAPGVVGQTVDFNFDEIDAALGLVADASPDARREAAELFGQIARWCFARQRTTLKTATAKFAVVIAGLHPEILDSQTFQQIGKQLGLTKAAMSKHAVKFSDAFAIKLSRCRSNTARAHMSNAALGHAPTNFKRTGTPAGGKGGGT